MNCIFVYCVVWVVCLFVFVVVCVLLFVVCGGYDVLVLNVVFGVFGVDLVVCGCYFVKVVDCVVCYIVKDGVLFVGGVVFELLFGMFYGLNIMFDKDYGIGNWSVDDFYVVLYDGKVLGKCLYLLMLYMLYWQFMCVDVDVMFVYLKMVKLVVQENCVYEFKFLYNLCFGMVFWDMLFLKDSLLDVLIG